MDEEKWWDKDAASDPIKSAAAISTKESSTPFTKLPLFPPKKYFTNKVIADLGCGYGRTLLPLMAFKPKTAYGLDISPVMLKKCAALAKKHHLHPKLIHSPLQKLPFKNASLDTIYSCAVLLHLSKEDLPPVLAEMKRVLKKGGHIFLQSSFPNSFSLNGLSNWFPALLKSQLTHSAIIPGMPKHYSYFELKKILTALNLPFTITPVAYEFLPRNLNRFPLPFRSQIKSLNASFNSFCHTQGLKFFLFLPTYFEVKITKDHSEK